MLTLTPVSGAPVLSATLPRRTDERVKSMVPGATPVWIGLAPVYKNSVEAKKLLAPVGSSLGATVEGSGGNPLPDTLMLNAWVLLPPRPSVTRTVTPKVPLEPGVQVISPLELMLMFIGDTESP